MNRTHRAVNLNFPTFSTLIVGILLSGCSMAYTPPGAPAVVPADSVRASFGRTWDAVIDHFAEASIPIRTLERGSGFIATERMAVVGQMQTGLADCGTGSSWQSPYRVDFAEYNVRVQGDSVRSSVRVTAAFSSLGPNRTLSTPIPCASSGRYERLLQEAIRERATAQR